MVASMHMPPPASKPRKSLSLRECMILHKPCQPHTLVGSPEVQHTGCLPAAPQNSTSTADLPTEQLSCSALGQDPYRPADSRGPSRNTLDGTGGRAHSTVLSASCRPGEDGDCKSSAAVQLHDGCSGGEGSDTDMTQEDMPRDREVACAKLPDMGTVPQPPCQQPEPPQSKGIPRTGCELGPSPLARHAELHQHPVDAAPMEADPADDEACWEQALEAEMQGLSGNTGGHMSGGQPCSKAEVIQLDVESADDMLDVLADAAAATPLARYRTRLGAMCSSIFALWLLAFRARFSCFDCPCMACHLIQLQPKLPFLSK